MANKSRVSISDAIQSSTDFCLQACGKVIVVKSIEGNLSGSQTVAIADWAPAGEAWQWTHIIIIECSWKINCTFTELMTFDSWHVIGRLLRRMHTIVNVAMKRSLHPGGSKPGGSQVQFAFQTSMGMGHGIKIRYPKLQHKNHQKPLGQRDILTHIPHPMQITSAPESDCFHSKWPAKHESPVTGSHPRHVNVYIYNM